MRKQSRRASDTGHAFDDVQAMVIFARVIQDRSFTRAAQKLGTSTSAVSKRIARLEQRAGARLLERTTRQLAPTETGLALYERCLRILREVEAAEVLVAGLAKTPRGLLRISAPVYFGELHIAPLVSELLRREPDLRVDLSLTDRFVDLIAEGFDLAVRIGALGNTSLMVRKLARTPVVACAAPGYLERRGRPAAPTDLLEHDCLRYSPDPLRNVWHFRAASGESISIPVTGALECNHGGALRQAAIAGLGVVLLPYFYVAEALARGTLVTVLDDYCAAELGIHGVYPAGRLVPPKTKVCVEWLARALPARLAGKRDASADLRRS
jgi:DNA-binding transcriptional LysR family regulator